MKGETAVVAAIIPNLTRKNAHAVTVSLLSKLSELEIRAVADEALCAEFESCDVDFLPFGQMIDECDVIISVGGDGTILHCAKYGDRKSVV